MSIRGDTHNFYTEMIKRPKFNKKDGWFKNLTETPTWFSLNAKTFFKLKRRITQVRGLMKFEFLKQLPFLNVGDLTKNKFAKDMRTLKFNKGTYLYKEGQPIKDLFFVIEGDFCLEKSLPKTG